MANWFGYLSDSNHSHWYNQLGPSDLASWDIYEKKLQSEMSDYTCKKPPPRNKKDTTRQEVEQPELLQTMKKPAAAISPTNGAGTNPDHINKKTKVRQESDKKRSNNVFLPGPTSMETTRSIVVKDVYQNSHD